MSVQVETNIAIYTLTDHHPTRNFQLSGGHKRLCLLTHTGIFLSFHPMHRRACSHALGSPACCFSKNVIVKELFREITVSSRDVTTYPLICLLIEQTPTALKFFRMRGYDFKSGFGNLTSERQAQDFIQTNALLKITPSLSLRCKQLN